MNQTKFSLNMARKFSNRKNLFIFSEQLNKKGDEADLVTKKSKTVETVGDDSTEINRKQPTIESDSLNSTSSEESSGNTKWMFARAQDRAKSREDEKKSDWLFDRAQGRKKFHDLMSADWNTRLVVLVVTYPNWGLFKSRYLT